MGQYPPPPPVATGPGLDRPLFIPTPDYNSEGYTMNRTRLFYQDHLDAADVSTGPTAFIYPEVNMKFITYRVAQPNLKSISMLLLKVLCKQTLKANFSKKPAKKYLVYMAGKLNFM